MYFILLQSILTEQQVFVIFDDCSTDNTEDMIRKTYSKDNRIRYIKREKNLGSLANTADAILNFGFGEWVILIGDDDAFIYNVMRPVVSR